MWTSLTQKLPRQYTNHRPALGQGPLSEAQMEKGPSCPEKTWKISK